MGEAANDYCAAKSAKEVKPIVTIMDLMYFLQRVLEDIRLLLNISLKLITNNGQKPEQLLAGMFAL
jgi:hypothetical protein